MTLAGLFSPRLIGSRRQSWILSAYIARHYLFWFFLILGVLVLCVGAGNAADLMDRHGNKDGVTLFLVLEMSLLKIPLILQDTLSFAVLAAGMLTLWRLNRTQEVAIARAAGVSVWQILAPMILSTLIVGVLMTTVVSPLSALFYQRFTYLEQEYLKKTASTLKVGPGGLWMRQPEAGGSYILNAAEVGRESGGVRDVMVLRFGENDTFLGRLDARRGRLLGGTWELSDVVVSEPGKPPRRERRASLETQMTVSRLATTSGPWENVSFWDMPAYAAALAAAGFPNERFILQFHRLLSLPMYLVGMLLVAAAFTTSLPRRGGNTFLVALGTVAGFLIYFFSRFVYALGLSGKLPAELAAWAPAAICLLLGGAALLFREDG